MPDLTLKNIPSELLAEWLRYAERAGLPAEYMIQEAVTHSVRSDRLGAEAARLASLQRQKTLVASKRTVNKNASSTAESMDESPPAAPSKSTASPDILDSGEQVVRNLPTEFMDSNESSAALEDFVPRNL